MMSLKLCTYVPTTPVRSTLLLLNVVYRHPSRDRNQHRHRGSSNLRQERPAPPDSQYSRFHPYLHYHQHMTRRMSHRQPLSGLSHQRLSSRYTKTLILRRRHAILLIQALYLPVDKLLFRVQITRLTDQLQHRLQKCRSSRPQLLMLAQEIRNMFNTSLTTGLTDG